MTFDEAIPSLMAELRLRNYSPATLKHYGNQLKRFGEWLPDEHLRDLRRVTREDVDSYQRYVRTEPISAGTRALRLQAVKRLFDHLTTAGQLLLHPAEHVIAIRRRDRLPKAVLTVKQVERLIEAPDTTTPLGIRDRALLETMYGTAIRVGELEKVFVTDIKLSEKILDIREGKGGKERIVPLGQTATQWIQRYLDEVRPTRVKNRPYERALFVTQIGKPLKQTQIREILRKYQRQCHLRKSVSPHGLRHACASHLLQAGADIRVIQQLLGHTKLDSTTIYTRVMPIDIKAVHQTYHPTEMGHKGEPDHAD
jgi:integrase/recombinase XerD